MADWDLANGEVFPLIPLPIIEAIEEFYKRDRDLSNQVSINSTSNNRSDIERLLLGVTTFLVSINSTSNNRSDVRRVSSNGRNLSSFH